ncbi:VOC family protein [uncultured Azohydromonas sp.]|jgi:Predicted enzyme related to lactoylglutathione lyase|uniref:VOC family protein n=1 Tax=uncultured Azohydromonas sp. TaxID=487342 RepID=UPI002635E45D|nr:VOC family protein [uncultured Azohydromonas sp.]
MNQPLLDHVQLPMPPGGAERARDFYARVLGLRELASPGDADAPRVLRFVLDGTTLDLREGPYTGVAPQAHLALQLRDVPAVVARLRAAGRPVDAWTLDETGRAVTEDPFGNRLELISRPAEPLLYRKDHHVTQLRISV